MIFKLFGNSFTNNRIQIIEFTSQFQGKKNEVINASVQESFTTSMDLTTFHQNKRQKHEQRNGNLM